MIRCRISILWGNIVHCIKYEIDKIFYSHRSSEGKSFLYRAVKNTTMHAQVSLVIYLESDIKMSVFAQPHIMAARRLAYKQLAVMFDRLLLS